MWHKALANISIAHYIELIKVIAKITVTSLQPSKTVTETHYYHRNHGQNYDKKDPGHMKPERCYCASVHWE